MTCFHIYLLNHTDFEEIDMFAIRDQSLLGPCTGVGGPGDFFLFWTVNFLCVLGKLYLL